ncbi:MAG TPA: hypothetical protein VHN14_33520, partial [Kofleriaceae bacterium]|nr:hypothetical protein [Kofleriaceae bacterium]
MTGDDRSRFGPRRPRGARNTDRTGCTPRARRAPRWGRTAGLSVLLGLVGDRIALADDPAVD